MKTIKAIKKIDKKVAKIRSEECYINFENGFPDFEPIRIHKSCPMNLRNYLIGNFNHLFIRFLEIIDIEFIIY